MKKFFIFDIDRTLCDINKPIEYYLAKVLQEVSEKHQVVLASGKPFGYIAGFVRQLNLKNTIIIGENGATINFGASFPPKKYYQVEISKDVKKLLSNIKDSFKENFKNRIWLQPNDVNVTVFPIDINDIESIHNFAKKFDCNLVNIYYHKDSADITPKGFDKGTAVDILLQKLNISSENLYVFGDGSNDLPMLKKTKNAFLVNSALENIEYKQRFNDYNELANYLKKFIN